MRQDVENGFSVVRRRPPTTETKFALELPITRN